MGRHSLYNKVITEFIIVAVMLLMLWLIELHNLKMDQRSKNIFFTEWKIYYFLLLALIIIVVVSISTPFSSSVDDHHFTAIWIGHYYPTCEKRLDFSPMKYDNVFNDWVSEYTSVYIYTRWFTISLVHIIIQ